MQIPVRWWVHIIPGLLIIISAFLWLFQIDQIINSPSLEIIVLPVLAILSYVAGLMLNSILVEILFPVLKPILKKFNIVAIDDEKDKRDWSINDKILDPKIVESCKDGYLNMVFWRSLFASSFILSVSIPLNICPPNWHLINFFILIIFEILAVSAISKTWWETRKEYKSYYLYAKKLAQQENN